MSKKQPKQKMGRRRDRHFYKKDIQMARRHMKRCSTLLIIGEMQIKSTLSYHLSALSMAFIKMSANSKGWKGWQEKGILLHCWWEYKLVQVPMENIMLPNRFSRVRLCAAPWTAAYQAFLSMVFSRQEHWSGLPFPSPMHEIGK